MGTSCRLALASAMCVMNFRSCGRYHCKITGFGFFGLGIMAVLDTVGVINLAAWIVWSALCCPCSWIWS